MRVGSCPITDLQVSNLKTNLISIRYYAISNSRTISTAQIVDEKFQKNSVKVCETHLNI